jgi:signal transduction histidine kinase/ActR/RegA family two-component response regulator
VAAQGLGIRALDGRIPRTAPAAIWLVSVGLFAIALVLALTDAVGRTPLAALVAAVILLTCAAWTVKGLMSPSERAPWLILALGKGFWALASAGYLANPHAVSEFPTVADLGLLCYPLAAVAYVLLARRRFPGLPRALWLDAAIGGVALAAFGSAVLYEPLLDGSAPGSVGVVAVIYTLCDLALAGFMAVGCLVAGWRVAPALWILAAGAALCAIPEAAFTVSVEHGADSASPLNAVGFTAGVLVLGATNAFDRQRVEEVREPNWSLIAVPVVASLTAVAILIANVDHHSTGVFLAEAVLLLAVGRLAMSLVDNRRAEETRRVEDEQRHAREEAERANRAKTEFLSRMSHEVRTPLNSILGFAQLLVDDLDGPERASVERILRAGNHLQRLIDDILDLSAIESGQTVMSLEPTDVDAAIEESTALLEPLARRTGTGIVRRKADDAPDAVVADPQRLKQILLNLVSNAIKYGAPRSDVVVCVECEGSRGVIKVIDQGSGIPDEDMPNLFTPFERGSAHGSGIEGSGLGLALTKNLVETMGGTIEVETGPSGSTFSVSLPAADPEEADRPVPARGDAPRVPAAGTRTILYVEDNASNIALVERLLSRRPGFDLLVATTGHAALTLIATVHPDVVLLDLDLPDMRGEEVLDRLRSDQATADIPVIVVSADATGWRQEELARAGAAAYVVKPIQLASFMATLDTVLTGSSARR